MSVTVPRFWDDNEVMEDPALGEPLADGACQQVTSDSEMQPLWILHWFFSI